ncbi:MAG: recombinase RecT [Bacteroidota bacterium]|nr:recombinase RecT [Bacteroidota bacterium]
MEGKIMYNTTKVKELLDGKSYPEVEVRKFIAYLDDTKRSELAKPEEKRSVTKNSEQDIYSIFVKYYNMGVLIDGVNAVIAGRNMAMVTYHGYKNAVLRAYPETEFDVQLVREGDEFGVAKESGSIIYRHNIADPFSQESHPIIGAYAIIKTKRGEYFEALNKADFDEMKKGSKMKYLWETWESEFWLKSVIKRACKRHFYDLVAEIDKQDNDDFGLEEKVKAGDAKKSDIIAEAKKQNCTTETETKEEKVEENGNDTTPKENKEVS